MWKLWGGCEGCVKSAIFAKSPTSLSSFSIAAPLPPRLLTREHVARFLEETWRSEFPVLYSIYLKQGGGVIILEETSGGALHSSTFCCCVREIIPFHKLFLVFFLSRISAEERRSGYEDVNFGCGHGNFMIGRSFVDTVSGLKITCNSLDQPEYPLSHRVYVYVAFWRQRKNEKRNRGKKRCVEKTRFVASKEECEI